MSNEKIDLLYLTNQNFIDKYNQKTKLNSKNDLIKDMLFYRKRILQSTKDLLRENSIDNTVDASFLQYVKQLINHYKFIDKKDVIQDEYKHLQEKKKKPIDPNFKLSDKDKLMTKEFKKNIKTIKDCLPLVVKTKNKKKRTYPKKKDINIKDPKFRIKGLEKEKSKQSICLQNQNIKEKELKEKIKNQNIQNVKQKKDKKAVKQKKHKEKNKIDLVASILGK